MAVLGAACAQSVEPANDGQTHWMQRCDSDSECGVLACVCGVCTETCSSDEDACVVAADAVCARASAALGHDACESDSVRVCAPACERQADCDDVGDDLTCSEETLCALAESVGPGHEPPDSGMQTENDAGAEDASQNDPPPNALLEVACNDDGALEGEGFAVVANGTFIESFVVAPDGAIYTLFEDESGTRGQGLLQFDDTLEPEPPIARSVYNIVDVAMNGDELFVVINDNGYEARIAQIDRQSGEATYLAREDALNPNGIVFDSEYVYWSAQVSQEPDVYLTRVWRSPREPGESELLAEIDSDARALQLVGGDLYTVGANSDGEAQLLRIPSAGGDVEVLEDGPTGLGALISDGSSLFTTTGGGLDDLGNNTNDARVHVVNLETLELEELFPAGRGSVVELIVSDDSIYWVMDENRETEGGHATQTVWRGDKDGSGAAEKIADVIGWAQPIVVHGDDLYWMAGCRLQPTRHIVRVTTR